MRPTIRTTSKVRYKDEQRRVDVTPPPKPVSAYRRDPLNVTGKAPAGSTVECYNASGGARGKCIIDCEPSGRSHERGPLLCEARERRLREAGERDHPQPVASARDRAHHAHVLPAAVVVVVLAGASQDEAPPIVVDQLPAVPVRSRVLVLPLRAAGVSADVARTTTSLLTIALQRRMVGTEVVSTEDIRAMADVEATKQILGCDEASCLAEIAGALGAARVAYGEVARLGDELIVTVSIFDTSTQRAQRDSVPARDEGRLRAAVEALVARVMGDAPLDDDDGPPALVWVGVAAAAAGVLVAAACAALGYRAVEVLRDPAAPGADKQSTSSLRPLYAAGTVGGVALSTVGIGVAAVTFFTE